MEYEGVKIDAAALAEFSTQLSKEISPTMRKTISGWQGTDSTSTQRSNWDKSFSMFWKIGDGPKKTKTGQYATTSGP